MSYFHAAETRNSSRRNSSLEWPIEVLIIKGQFKHIHRGTQNLVMAAAAPRGFTVGPRRMRRDNLVGQLRDRELGAHQVPVARGNAHLQLGRQVYWNIYPRRTLYDVQMMHDHQQVVFRKFSPCGKVRCEPGFACPVDASTRSGAHCWLKLDKNPLTNTLRCLLQYLLCFSKGQHAVAVFRYKGPGYDEDSVIYPPGQSSTSEDAAPTISFNTFFELSSETTLTSGNEMLCKDFSLFTDDKKIVIVVSAVPCGTTGPEARRNPSSLSILPTLDDVTFWSLDMATGKVLDKKTFKSDFIYLSHLAGVHLYGNQLAITSVQNQTIHILEVQVGCQEVAC